MKDFDMVLTRNRGEEKLDLEQLCEKLSPGLSMAEIGSYAGGSATIFLKSGKVSEIVCVDMWEGDYDGNDICSFLCPMRIVEQKFDECMRVFRDQDLKVTKLKKASVEAAATFADGTFDLVYVDACHLYESVREDLIAWIPKVKRGGFISGHDFGCALFPGVKKAVLEIVGKPQFLFVGGSWMKQI